MRTTYSLVLAASLLSAVSSAQAEATTALFDGQSLAGWAGDARVWSVQDGALMGSTHGVNLKANTFLIHEGVFGDFELRLKVRMEGQNNGGVQYRSRVMPKREFGVAGYQCDVHPKPEYAAMLYGEGAGGIVAQHGQFVRWTDGGRAVIGELAAPAASPVDFSEWHDLRIVAVGNLVYHELDGQLCTALLDDRGDAPRSGKIALQVHRGPKMKVWYRDLELRTFSGQAPQQWRGNVPPLLRAYVRKAELERSKATGPTPQWLWDAAAGDEEELFFRRSFQLSAAPDKAQLGVSVDNHCRIYVNGERAGKDDSWDSPTLVEVAGMLKAGENVVAVHAWNDGGPAGMVARLGWLIGDEAGELVSDASWRCGADDPDGWDSPGFDDRSWSKATVLGPLGGDVVWSGSVGRGGLGGGGADAYAPQVAFPADDLQMAAGGPVPGATTLLEVPRALGSWVSLCADDRGRLYSCDQRKAGLFRVEPASEVGEVTTFERMPAALSGAHGLLWFRGALYAVVNGGMNGKDGLYRVTDKDGDDLLEHVELLREFDGSGEHGPHSIAVAPDGEHLLVLNGNMTRLTDIAVNRVPSEWQEDRLTPRINDARGFWGGYSPPGGCLYQIDPDAKRWELICCGFRNPFDFAVLPNGQIVVYDADMEWDLGLPWYRPTRWLAGQSGVDYGWRKGSAKWSDDYPDAPAALQDIGPGSPTGMIYVPGERGGIFGLDWTFGTLYREGAPWIVGAPWPVADITWSAVTPDCIYVVAGGRGLPSRLVRLPLQEGAPASLARWGQPVPWTATEARSAEDILDAQHPGTDPYVTMRIALERLPVDEIREAVLDVDPARPDRAFAGLMAVARRGAERDLKPILDALGWYGFGDLDHDQRVAWIRVHALALMRLGPASRGEQQLVADRMMPLFPCGDERVDADLCELLAFVQAPGLLEKAVPMLAKMRPSEPPAWTVLASRNASYGGVINKMIENMPPIGQLAIADSLRLVEHGWSVEQRRTVFRFLHQARSRSGGASFDGFLIRIVDGHWDACSAGHRRELEFDVGRARAKRQKFRSKPPKGPGRDWQVSDIASLVRAGFDGRKRGAGRNLFHAAGCATCHYFEGEGGFGGPDLTSLKNKMRPQDLLESILEPSKVISDQYAGKVLTKKDGTAFFGVAHKTWDGDMQVYEVVEAKADAVPLRVPVEEVARVEPSPMSPMPKDLVDSLSADELRDLVAYLLGKSK
ncbi:MAG: family 16 glycoside hydrolase [Planctomycetota bacterium]|nr:family 16 glycoside hydrolase [Planctomycetota bacterium]